MVELSHILSNNDTPDADELMDNFNDLKDGIANLGNADIRAGAGIDSRKLAEPYTTEDCPWQILPFALNADVSAPTGWTTLPAALTTIGRFRPRLRTGQIAWITELEFFIVEAGQTGGSPEINVLVDGVQIGGSVVTITQNAAYWTLSKPNPVDNPLVPVTNQSVVEVQIRESAGSPTIRGITARVSLKRSMVP